MAEGLQEKQSQQSKQIGEAKLPQWVLSSPKYQEEKGYLDTKKSALKALAFIPCASEDLADYKKFIWYIEAHTESDRIYTTINLLPKEELISCFDIDTGTSFADACTPEFIDSFCKKAKQEIVETEQKKTETEQKKTETEQKKTETEQKGIELQQKLENLRIDFKNKHPDLYKKYGEIIDQNASSSEIFKNAVKSILLELKSQAQKTGDFQEYRSFVEQFHSIGAVSDEEFTAFKKELDGFLNKPSGENGKDGKPNASETIGKDLRNHEYEKIGEAYVRFGEKTDEIVRIDEKSGNATKRVVSGMSGYSREIVLPESPATIRLQKEGKINERLSDIGNKLEKIAGYKQERKALEEKPEWERSEKEQARLKELGSIDEAEQRLLSERTDLETEKKQLPEPDARAQETQEQKEENARDVIGFVDDMGLYMFGVENVDRFFGLVDTKTTHGKIDMTDGIDENEKMELKKAFISLLGEDIFEAPPSFKLREGKTPEDIKNLLKTRGLYEEGKIPPVEPLKLEGVFRNPSVSSPQGNDSMVSAI